MNKSKRCQLGNDMMIDGVEEQQENSGKRSSSQRSKGDDSYSFLTSSGLIHLARQQTSETQRFW